MRTTTLLMNVTARSRRARLMNLLLHILQGGAVAASMVAVSTSMTGCDSGAHSAQLAPTEFSIHPSATKLVAGEIATVTVQSANTLGRDAEVRWETSGGDLTTQQNGMVARIRFDQPGRYVVTSRLYLDGDLVQRDSTNIEVVPLTRPSDRPVHDDMK